MQPLLDQYLSNILGQPVASEPLDEAELRIVPRYLVQRYRFSRASLLGRPVVFAAPTVREGSTPSSVSKDFRQIQERLNAAVVIVRERLPSWERGRYVAAGIPFVVPGEQMFLPMMMIDLRDVKRRTASEVEHHNHLTWAAQVVVLRHLLFGDIEGASLQDLAGRLGYSRMTLTNVQRELESHGLCRVEKAGRTKQLDFEPDRAALWQQALVVTRSPVRERQFLARCDVGLPASGLIALAARTDIAGEALPVVAVAGSRVKQLVAGKQLLTTPDPDAAVATIEVWNYDPTLLTRERLVDPLSMILSLRDDPDERVQAALSSMMEALPWSTG